MKITGKKVIIIGGARSGMAAAKLLLARGAKVDISDNRDDALIRKDLEGLGKIGAGIELGGHTPDFVRGHQIAILSPGVSSQAPVISWLKSAGIRMISEIELAYSLFQGEIIAVTGTNGKTTVTALIGKMLNDAGRKAVVCGNIGNPFSNEVIRQTNGLIAVVEISSFQLEWIKDFRPHLSLILNVTDDHLDRYRNFDHYLQTKLKISINQKEGDFCLINSGEPYSKKIFKKTRAKILYFDNQNGNFDLNQQAVMLAGSLYGLSKNSMLKTLNEFKPFSHRMEYINTVNGIKFINDSKATNVGAVKWALERISEPVILIAGGRNKKNDFKKLRPWVKNKVRQAVLVGEARAKLKNALDGVIPFKETFTFTDAFKLAYSIAKPGEVVLLSPACTSFDMFSNFEERGEAFRDLVARCKEQGQDF
ncbi:MAG: Mur ligase family protein [Candidatus Omnitrophota bacterium]|nr:Mur ligase family protein [Candidatus Omnitrophota bacterium]